MNQGGCSGGCVPCGLCRGLWCRAAAQQSPIVRLTSWTAEQGARAWIDSWRQRTAAAEARQPSLLSPPAAAGALLPRGATEGQPSHRLEPSGGALIAAPSRPCALRWLCDLHQQRGLLCVFLEFWSFAVGRPGGLGRSPFWLGAATRAPHHCSPFLVFKPCVPAHLLQRAARCAADRRPRVPLFNGVGGPLSQVATGRDRRRWRPCQWTWRI